MNTIVHLASELEAIHDRINAETEFGIAVMEAQEALDANNVDDALAALRRMLDAYRRWKP